MAEIKINTLTDDCFETCPSFNAELSVLRANGKVFIIEIRCENLWTCINAKEHILNEKAKDGDTDDD